MVARDTAGLVIPLGLPLLIMVMNGLGAADEPITGFGGLTAMDAVITPLTLVMIVAVIGMVNMPSFLAMYRTTGVLRRLAVTPAPPAMVLAAQMVVSLAQLVLGVALALGVARVAFGSAPRHLATAGLVLVLTTAAMYAVGLLIAAVAPTTNSAVAMGLIAFFATMAAGGGFGPSENLPDVVARVGELLPFGAAFEALRAAWIGQSPTALHLVALAVTAVGGGVLATKLFRWD